tara:strand:+ start:44 stop:409 length:366 start_codon:yes stop_codon:yes gene_type:complete
MGFKLGKETRRARNSKDTPIFRKTLDKGILGEANMDGSVFIDKSVKPGSAQEQKVINHEGLHAKEMKSGKIEYGDDFVRDGKKTYHRKTRNGKDMVKVNGEWIEVGDNRLAWEKRAIKAEK